MTDRELLERAAKAAGMETRWDQPRGAKSGVVRARFPGSGDAFPVWSPLTDDGDALRLAVKLRLDIEHFGASDCSVSQITDDDPFGRELAEVRGDDMCSDPYAATRRAIVRAAAEMAP